MRISILLLIGICISIAIAEKEPSKEKPSKVSAPASKTSKSGKSLTDNRGKRTLTNLGYPGFSYNVDANRRQGIADGRAFYSQDGLYNGQSAIGQYSFPETSNHLADYNQFSQYPQFLEAPEPIIEIIIKDSNETLPTQAPQPLIQKKKKEKVHVYYVKYKKDENNKLHLEEPIASLNNHETDATEEEEEIIHYPTIVTPIPPLKTTTLRTIIHPDSEKFHSNSGIHVTFGSEDRSQSGHELQEDNAESVLSSVVALPQTAQNFPSKPAPTANVRADFGDPRTAIADRYQGYQGSFYQNQNVQPEYKPAIQQQQLPVAQSLTAFRPQQQHQNFQQQQQQYQQQQQHRQYYNQVQQTQNQPPKQYPRPTLSTPPSASQYQNYQQQNVFTQQQQQQHYQFNQQQQQQHQQQQQQPRPQQYQQQQQQQQRPQPPKQNVFFPTPPSKSQDLPPHQSSGSYQPVKFRPTPVPNAQKVDNSNRPPLAQIQPYNRPPSFVQKPTFSTQPQGSIFDSNNRYQKPQVSKSPSPRPEQNYNQQQIPYNHKPSSVNNFSQNPTANLGQLHNFFDIRPSKETELLKAIPKFEQHITEVGGNRYNNYSPFSSGNQVIHDIPAPNLGPTTPSSQQASTAGQYNINSGSYRQQFNNFVTSPSPLQYQSTTQAPQYIQSNDGQQIQIVTPMPSSNFYNNHHHQSQSQSQFVSSGSQPQIIPNSQPRPQQQQQQQLYSQQQQPRQSESSQFSVSTLHSDVFKELEHRKNSLTKTGNNNESKNNYNNFAGSTPKSPAQPTTTASSSTISKNAAQASLQLPDEVPEDLRQQLLTSGILDNADISVLDYDKVGDVALENLPAEHLQHFYGAGGGAQISESNKVLTVVKPNGDTVNLSEKSIGKGKETKSLPQKQNVDLKVVRFNANNEKSISDKFIKTDSTVVPPVDLADRQYSRYLPLKINGAQFPIPDVEELRGKKVASVVVLAPVDNLQGLDKEATDDGRSERDTADSKEVKFISGDIIKQLIKKPTRDNFRKWLEKESRTDVDSQSVVLLVAKSPEEGQEIFMYDIATGAVNKLNGELSSAFVSVAEENASAENLDHASTLDPSILENMMEKKTTV